MRRRINMPRGLTQEEYKEKVKQAVGDKYTVLGKYTRRGDKIKFHCNIHDIDFEVTAECFMRGPNDVRGSCPQCAQDKRDASSPKIEFICAYCGQKFLRTPSKVVSKSGLQFCCREHKDLAQRIASGKQFDEMRPNHYGGIDSGSGYRTVAFRTYPHKCAICGWDEDEDILQVHHIDENRKNAKPENLIILCPTCHWKLTTGKYQLVEREKIELKEQKI